MKIRKRFGVGVISAVLLGGSPLFAPASHADDVAPMSCYGSATTYSKPAPDEYLPAGRTFTATSNCSGINIRPRSDRYIKVCVERNGAPVCASDFTYVPANTWKELRANVADGTQFSFLFRSSALSNGSWAA
ncbi:hypothetical protein [Streptomyces yaizuensis]|uniref:Secreted protein n=1 Tax=Streptomyces yaizuensis TaxID=2989713 RepID=A0ABQ5P610_9ACTN|nr:hypothetical protein [Streptomyces sp. YSPA8]GLF98029.1 hypothetical protein SYYSPA8_27050 [Streptomyces sp. YSPA8]